MGQQHKCLFFSNVFYGIDVIIEKASYWAQAAAMRLRPWYFCNTVL